MVARGAKLDLGFSVKAVCGGTVKTLTFAELLSRRTVVSVYMKNKTPSCDRQNDQLQACAPELRQMGFDVVAVSRDTAGSHQRYAAARQISYTLVSDPQDGFARATESLIEKSMYGRAFVGPARAAYVLEPDGTVLAVIGKVDTADHATQLKAAVTELVKSSSRNPSRPAQG